MLGPPKLRRASLTEAFRRKRSAIRMLPDGSLASIGAIGLGLGRELIGQLD